MDFYTKVGIVCCSNGQHISYKDDIHKLDKILRSMGIEPVYSDYIYEKDSVYSGTARERANSLMDFYMDDSISAIYDISGGDIANEILPYLDYDVIKNSNKAFWGYSDITTIINAIYTKTGNPGVLYQIKNLVWDKSKEQIGRYYDYAECIYIDKKYNDGILKNLDLFKFNYEFLQGDSMEGVVIGGNVRCFLKLAGTEYFPDTKDKVLLLESLGGEVPQMITYLNQLKQIGVFSKIKGLIFGTFTTMEEKACKPDIVELVKQYVSEDLPIVKTYEIGHGYNSKAIVIGKKICIKS
ncbi:MAG: LD-carboxypeptidase [Lachnospiraceae bacterium]|nr:LD-carboxypeptidase [Lachnospiraceae bacterium]